MSSRAAQFAQEYARLLVLPGLLLPLLQKSVKCYSYLEASELGTAGSMVLEVYKKPAEYKRKGRPTLLTTKPMYLQLSKALTSHQSNAVCVTHCH